MGSSEENWKETVTIESAKTIFGPVMMGSKKRPVREAEYVGVAFVTGNRMMRRREKREQREREREREREKTNKRMGSREGALYNQGGGERYNQKEIHDTTTPTR